MTAPRWREHDLPPISASIDDLVEKLIELARAGIGSRDADVHNEWLDLVKYRLVKNRTPKERA